MTHGHPGYQDQTAGGRDIRNRTVRRTPCARPVGVCHRETAPGPAVRRPSPGAWQACGLRAFESSSSALMWSMTVACPVQMPTYPIWQRWPSRARMRSWRARWRASSSLEPVRAASHAGVHAQDNKVFSSPRARFSRPGHTPSLPVPWCCPCFVGWCGAGRVFRP
jgi:hypothetical protein